MPIDLMSSLAPACGMVHVRFGSRPPSWPQVEPGVEWQQQQQQRGGDGCDEEQEQQSAGAVARRGVEGGGVNIW